MRSRPARLTLSALAWFALGAAAFVTVQSHQQVGARRTALRSFQATGDDAIHALADAQAAQQAYVAAGQELAEWAPKSAAYLQTAASSLDMLRAAAQSSTSAQALLDASTAITQVGAIDRRARASVDATEFQAAADLIFSEGADAVASAVSNIEMAIGAEVQMADAFEAAQQRLVVYAAGGGLGLAAIILAILGIAAPAAKTGAEAASATDTEPVSDQGMVSIGHLTPAPDPLVHPSQAPAQASLTQAAELCADFARVREATELKALLERAAGLLNARGIIVWLGSPAGADLRPVLAHGYSDQTLTRIPSIPRSADNAAAEAYRTGSAQVVKGRPGASQGSIIAPMIAADGCIGALTAEIKDRGEESEATRALATLVASQLAGVLAAAASAEDANATGTRAAAR